MSQLNDHFVLFEPESVNIKSVHKYEEGFDIWFRILFNRMVQDPYIGCHPPTINTTKSFAATIHKQAFTILPFTDRELEIFVNYRMASSFTFRIEFVTTDWFKTRQ